MRLLQAIFIWTLSMNSLGAMVAWRAGRITMVPWGVEIIANAPGGVASIVSWLEPGDSCVWEAIAVFSLREYRSILIRGIWISPSFNQLDREHLISRSGRLRDCISIAVFQIWTGTTVQQLPYKHLKSRSYSLRVAGPYLSVEFGSAPLLTSSIASIPRSW